MKNLIISHLRAILRDKVLYAVFGVALVMILSVPSLSSFSMRQVQELAITLSLSAISLMLLVVTLLLGASSIWRDIERRYTSSILSLPISRGTYIISKFISIGIFQLLCILVLGAGAALVIAIAAQAYPSDIPVHWGNIVLTLYGYFLKYLLLAGFALVLSAVSTSFYLPFFGTLVLYMCGNASQEVFEYVTSQFGHGLHPLSSKIVTALYYVLPNFSAFNFQVQAIYGLDIQPSAVGFPFVYAIIYTSILLGVAVFAFNKRELL